MESLNYKDINQVITSWEIARQMFGVEEELGIHMLLRLFDLEPETKKVFNLGPNMKLNGIHRMAVLIHGRRMVDMLNGVFGLMGPDLDMLQELLSQAGDRHRSYGVKAEYIPLLGQAIRETLKGIMGAEAWTEELNSAWIRVYAALSISLVESLRKSP